MITRRTILTAGTIGLVCGVAASASAGPAFRLINTQNLDPVCADPTNPLFVGNNISAIELVTNSTGTHLFVGGFNNNSAVTNVRVVKVENVLGERAFRGMPDADFPAGTGFGQVTQSRGVTGLNYRPGLGLLVSVDRGSAGPIANTLLFDVDTQLNPILLAPDLNNLPNQFRGVAGPSWDLGPDINGDGTPDGIDLTGNGEPDGPAVAVIDFSIQNSKFGPAGYKPDTLDALDTAYLSTSVSDGQGGFITSGPVLEPTGGQTIWRDLEIHPRNGIIAARANNDVLLGFRENDGSVENRLRVFTNGRTGPTDTEIQVGQQLTIVHDICPGSENDFVIYNNRPVNSGGQAFASVVEFLNVNTGAPVSVDFLDENGQPMVFPDSVGYYSFSWDPESRLLAISDFASGPRTVWIFQAPFNADINGDGVVDADDFFTFLSLFAAGDSRADVNNDGVIDADDFFQFLAAFANPCSF
ncbi:MAG: hypothetical protein EA423_12435 [Phycisphaerales bacterium]|nr:MAG: hypothetical protein EA423_12435 [Phycisphaerales bacterium]